MKRIATAACFAVAGSVATALGFGLPSDTALASHQSACGVRQVVIDGLQSAFGEAPVALGVVRGLRSDLTASMGGIEVFAAAEGATFTILFTRPDGLSCVVAAGVEWQRRPMPTLSPGRPVEDPS